MRFLITVSMLALMALFSSPASAQCKRFDTTTCTEHEWYLRTIDGEDFALDFLSYIPPTHEIPTEYLDYVQEQAGFENWHWIQQWYDHYRQAEHPIILAKEALRYYVQHDDVQSRENALSSIEIIAQTPIEERSLLRQLYLIRMYQLLGELNSDAIMSMNAEQAFEALADEALRRRDSLPYDQGRVVKRLLSRGDFIVLGARYLRNTEDKDEDIVINVDPSTLTFHVDTVSGETWLSGFDAYRQYHADRDDAIAQFDLAAELARQEATIDEINEWWIRAANNGSLVGISVALTDRFEQLVSLEQKCQWVSSLANRGEDLTHGIFKNNAEAVTLVKAQCNA